jgi:hypothetical protein
MNFFEHLLQFSFQHLVFGALVEFRDEVAPGLQRVESESERGGAEILSRN